MCHKYRMSKIAGCDIPMNAHGLLSYVVWFASIWPELPGLQTHAQAWCSNSTAIVMPPPLQRAFSFLCCHCFKLERWVTLILPFLIIFVVQHLPPSNFCSFYFYTFLLFSLIFSPLAHSSFALTSIPQLFIAIANSRLFSSVSSLFAFCFCFFYCFNCFLTSLSCLLLLKGLLNGWLYV